jgi:similar to stage IV sporulation protein
VVWQVRVSGAEHLDESEVLELAGQMGIRPWVWKRNLNLPELEEELARRHADITWAGIRLRGTLVIIEIVEHLREPEIDQGPADLIAAKDGLIVRLLVLDGEAQVAVGDTVVEGDLLIRGVMTIPDPALPPEQQPDPVLVRARGEVEARVWYEAVVPLDQTVVQENDSGRSRKSYTLKWPDGSLRLGGPRENPFDSSRQDIVKWRWRWRNLSIPVELVTVTYHEILVVKKEVSRGEALQHARDEAMARLRSLLPEAVAAEQLYFQEFTEQSREWVRAVAETREDIAEIRRLSP